MEIKNNPEERDFLKAISESLQKFSHSLTGKNLEERLIEYSEVYGEILLYLYKNQEEYNKKLLALKKEIQELEKKIISNIPQKESKNPSRRLILIMVFITMLNFLLLILNFLK